MAGAPLVLANETRDRALVCAYLMAGASEVQVTESLDINPALPELHRLYSSGIAAIVNKVSPPKGYGSSANQRYSSLRFLDGGFFTSKWASPESSVSVALPSGVTVVSRSAADAAALAAAARTAVLPVTFPETGIGQQFREAAAVLRMRKTFGLTDPVLTCAISGFRPGQPELNAALLGELSSAMSTFYRSLAELGIAKQVATYTDMDFGADPKAGRSQIVVGGSVNGGRIFAGNGGITSYEAYTATLARWQGAAPTAGASVLTGLLD